MAQFGFATEATAGLAATPTKFATYLAPDEFDIDPETVEAQGVRAGRNVRHRNESNGGNIAVAGSVSYELATNGHAVLWKHKMGAVQTTDIGGGLYSHVFTPAYTPGLAATLQFAAGTDPKTIVGAVCDSWEVAGEEGAFLTCSDSFIAMRGEIGSRSLSGGETVDESNVLIATGWLKSDIGKTVTVTGMVAGYVVSVADDLASAVISVDATATATGLTVIVGKPLATPSYPATQHYYKLHMANLTVAGNATKMKSFTLSGTNQIEPDFNAGSRWSHIPSPPENADVREYTGSFNTEYLTNAEYNRLMAGEFFDIDIVAAYGTSSITFACEGRYEPGLTPKGGRGKVMHDVGFRLVGNATDATALTITQVSSEASAA